LVPEHEQPIVEARQLAPRNPYSVSKVAAEALCYQYSQTSSFDCIMARPFNHIGPNQSSRFVVSDFAKQLVEIKAGLREPFLNVGNIDVSRDFTDVRDVVSAYLQLLKHGRNSEVYNVCSGTAITIREIIGIMVNVLGIDVVVQKDASRFRRAEQKIVCGKAVKIRDELGWAPTISIHQSIEDILNYWEKKINE
jgi:GDP-4-dehydro-6-deoxy-D-mannose reductase